MKAKLAEMEKEKQKLSELEADFAKDMEGGSAGGSGESKEEIDARSVFVGHVSG